MKVEAADEVVDISPCLCDILLKLGILVRAVTISNWAEGIPEEFMVQMAPAVEFDILLKRDNLLGIFFLGSFQCLLNELIQIVHIGAMMLTIVEIHKMAADNGLKCSHFEGQVLKLNNTRCARSRESFLENRFGANHI